MISVPHIHVYS